MSQPTQASRSNAGGTAVAQPSAALEPLFVVVEQCKFAADRSAATITVEARRRDNFSLAIEDLQGTPARHLAISFAAQQGVPDPRQNGNVVGPYPVNSEGTPLENVVDQAGQPLPQQDPRMQPAAYRVDVPVCRRLV